MYINQCICINSGIFVLIVTAYFLCCTELKLLYSITSFQEGKDKGKNKGRVLALLQRCLHESDSWPEALYNFGSGS